MATQVPSADLFNRLEMAVHPSSALLAGMQLDLFTPRQNLAPPSRSACIGRKAAARVVLWQICAQLAEMETARGNHAAAQALIDEGRMIVAYIADHACREDLRDVFQSSPLVQKLMSDPGARHD